MDPGSPSDRSDNADQLPRHTTPTWEVELLISGIAVFAMLQLPGWLDDRWFALRPRLDTAWLESLQIIYFYTKGASLILAVTFVAHLLLRARWIAQVGMHSVHPDGIDWGTLNMGPVRREVEQQQYGSAEASIDRADNRATTVFAIGVTLATILLSLAVFVLVGVALVQWLSDRLGLQWPMANVLLVVFALLLLPGFLANRIDRAWGPTLARQSGTRRLLAGIFRLYGRFGVGRGQNPTLALVASRTGRLRLGLMITITFLLAMSAAINSYRAQRDPAALGQYASFPQVADATRHVDSAHYEDTRDPDRDDAVPYVQSAVVTGPYLELVVPYRPARDAVAMQACAASTAGRNEVGGESSLACLQRLHAVTLDGATLRGLRYDIGSDPRTDRPALVAMIDVRALATGRHELQVGQAPLLDDSGAKSETSERIAFWR
jgi:hypothetical protein